MRAATVNAAMKPWTDAEVSRFNFRVWLFSRRGLSAFHAEALADRLALRDQGKDRRRVCAECSNYIHESKCAKRGPLLMDILQHCGQFAWEKPKQ